ncbi:MAG: hypothetical protein ACOYM8_13420, partial [Caulobacterales bacterium]
MDLKISYPSRFVTQPFLSPPPLYSAVQKMRRSSEVDFETTASAKVAANLAREFLSAAIRRGADFSGIFASAGLPMEASTWLDGPMTGRQLQQIIVPVMDRLDDAAV